MSNHNNNKKHLGFKITCFIVIASTVIAYYFIKHGAVQESVILVPIEFTQLPDNLIIARSSAEKIETRVRGPENTLKNLTAPVCRLNLSGAQSGEKFVPVSPDLIALPSGIKIIETIPTAVVIFIEKNSVKEVPVEITYSGPPAKGYRIAGVLASPASVKVSGPESILANISIVKTKPIDISGISESIKKGVVPVLEKNLAIIAPEEPVVAEISITEKIITKKLSLSVTSQNKGVEIVPPTADIEISGPENQLSRIDAPSEIKIAIDVTNLQPGVYVRRASITLPVDFTLSSVKPELFTVVIN